MKRTFAASAATFAMMLMSGAAMAGGAADKSMDPAMHAGADAKATAPAVTLPAVSGKITKVDEAAGKITIDHQAIPNLSMEAMTMVFKASDPALLKAVKSGDTVKFTADKVNGQLTVMSIQKGK